jgi:hypothetical protein
MLGDQALDELGPFLLVGFEALVDKHLANLRYSSLLLISKLLQFSLQIWVNAKNQEIRLSHLRNIAAYSGSEQ